MADKQASNVPTYGDRLAVLRRYFDGYQARDGYDARRLTPQQKSAITRKYNAFRAFESQALAEQAGARWVPVKTKKKDAIERVRALGPGADIGYPKGLRGWAVVAVPGDVTSVGVTRTGRAQVTDKAGVRMVFEPMDPRVMAKDPKAAAERMRRLHPNADLYAVRAGEYGWAKRDTNLGTHPDFIEAAISRLLYRYGAEVPGEKGPRADKDWGKDRDLSPRATDSNYYANWVTGMVAFYMPRQVNRADWVQYVIDTTDAKRRDKARRKKRSQRERLKGRQG